MQIRSSIIAALIALSVAMNALFNGIGHPSNIPLAAYAATIVVTYIVSDVKGNRRESENRIHCEINGLFLGFGIAAVPLTLSDISVGQFSSATTTVIALGMLCVAEWIRRRRLTST